MTNARKSVCFTRLRFVIRHSSFVIPPEQQRGEGGESFGGSTALAQGAFDARDARGGVVQNAVEIVERGSVWQVPFIVKEDDGHVRHAAQFGDGAQGVRAFADALKLRVGYAAYGRIALASDFRPHVD